MSDGGLPDIDYRPIQALLRELPNNSRWTQGRREKWLRAFTATIDMLIETVDASLSDKGEKA